MKRNYRFILGASNDIDRRTLQYLLDPPKLWEPEPPQIDRSHVTLYFSKGLRNVLFFLGNTAIFEKGGNLISGILAEDSSRDHFSNICDGQK